MSLIAIEQQGLLVKKVKELERGMARQRAMTKAYRMNAERYERERTAAVNREKRIRQMYRRRLNLMHEKWSLLYYEKCQEVKQLQDECEHWCEMDKVELAHTEDICEVRNRLIVWLKEAHERADRLQRELLIARGEIAPDGSNWPGYLNEVD